MIGLDTNVLVRFLTEDDPRQSRVATKLLEDDLSSDSPGYVCSIVLAELVWVLTAAYAATRDEITATIEGLLAVPNLAFEHKSEVWQALRAYRAGKADFSDCLIAQIGRSANCAHVVTFDKAAAKLDGFSLLQ